MNGFNKRKRYKLNYEQLDFEGYEDNNNNAKER